MVWTAAGFTHKLAPSKVVSLKSDGTHCQECVFLKNRIKKFYMPLTQSLFKENQKNISSEVEEIIKESIFTTHIHITCALLNDIADPETIIYVYMDQ